MVMVPGNHEYFARVRSHERIAGQVAAAEHGVSDDPYLFELDGAPNLLAYGYEQQGAIVEEYVCCRALAPTANRTRRLHDMLNGAFPVSPLPRDGRREHDVILPWKDADLRGICA